MFSCKFVILHPGSTGGHSTCWHTMVPNKQTHVMQGVFEGTDSPWCTSIPLEMQLPGDAI